MSRTKKKAVNTTAEVERAIKRGEILNAAQIVKDADLSEEEFDAIMEGRPDLRDVFLRLA